MIPYTVTRRSGGAIPFATGKAEVALIFCKSFLIVFGEERADQLLLITGTSGASIFFSELEVCAYLGL
jgi:hypothetical protein